MKLTDPAQMKMKSVLSAQPDTVTGIRVQVLRAGCSGYQYRLAFEKAAEANDQVFDFDGVRLFVDPGSQAILEGAEIDYLETPTATGFKFNLPQASGCTGCGGACK